MSKAHLVEEADEKFAPTRQAAVYVRRSHKDAEGSERNGRSLSQQEDECRALALRAGLHVVQVYSEREGTGASPRSRKQRPAWEAAVADLRNGSEFRTLIVWALDRADRRGAVEIGALLNEHSDGTRRVLGVDGTDTADKGMRIATLLRAEMAREESERTAARVERSKRAARAEGRWLGGVPPYGLKSVGGRLVHDAETFPFARRIAEEALAGRTLWEIVNGLNNDRVPTPAEARRMRSSGRSVDEVATSDALPGKGWGIGTISQLLRSPAFAGLQSIRARNSSGNWQAVADVYRDQAGQPVSVGQGVVTLEERRKILTMLGERTRSSLRARAGRRPVSSLLSDVVRCASCERHAAASGASSGYRSYRCGARASGRLCDGFTAPMEAVDEVVTSMVLRRVAAHEPGEELLEQIALRWTRISSPEQHADVEEARGRLTDLEGQLDRVQDLAVSGVFTSAEAARRVQDLRMAIEEERDAMRRLAPATADLSPLLDVYQSRSAWDALPLLRRREILRLAVERVEVTRGGGRGRRFAPSERLRVHWTDGSTSVPNPHA